MSAVARVAAWWALLALVGWVCLTSAADRLAGQGVLLGGAPALLGGGQALTARAELALSRGDARAALALGRAAVARRPIDPAALRVTGAAALAAGDPGAGDRLLRLAGAAGWRDGATQRYWAAVAASSGAWDVAAERLDAALRVDPTDRVAAQQARALERSPAGDAALARRLAVSNGWGMDWLASLDGSDAAGVRARGDTLARVWRGLAPADRDRIGWALVDAGATDLAWRLLRPGDGVASLATAREHVGPFGWTLASAAGLDAAAAGQGAGAALRVQASGAAPVPVASTTVLLPAGESRLALAVAGARTDLPLLVTLDCRAGGAGAAEPLDAPRGQALFRLRPPPGCASARLTVAVSGSEAARGAELRLGAVRLSRAP